MASKKMSKCSVCGGNKKWGKYAFKKELKSGICPTCWNKLFSVSSIARADIAEHFSNEQMKHLTDRDMELIASKMGDSYSAGGYWDDLVECVEHILKLE